MTDCAMMGVDWRALTLWEYQALLTTWNDRHSADGPAAPEIDRGRALAAMAAATRH